MYDTALAIERRSCSATPSHRLSPILSSLAITKFAIPEYRRLASGPGISLGVISPSISTISGSQEAWFLRPFRLVASGFSALSIRSPKTL